ncbi:MAG: thiamine phosphate synthase [marine benthic group bacterium]|nr:thiamine phosphate synthase [Candidatus Carthagonibacter metallireducens]
MPDGRRRAHSSRLAARLRLMVLTVRAPACGRSLVTVVAECLDAGATSIQLRDKDATARELYEIALKLVPEVRARDALLIVNDRFDVALAAGADGVHLGPEDLPVREVRARVPDGFVIGVSVDDPSSGREAAESGADYLGVGAVFGTTSKPGLEFESIGPERVAEVLEAANLPGVGIGGITPENVARVARVGAGVAVLGAVMHAEDPARAVLDLVRAIEVES